MKFYTGEFYSKRVLNPLNFHLDYTVLLTALREDLLMFAYLLCTRAISMALGSFFMYFYQCLMIACN
jgi:hypothetical protein